MSYYAQHQMAYDGALVGRVTAAVAGEHQAGNTTQDPEQWTSQNRHFWAASPGWADAWDSAVAAENPDPGADPAVITDAQILSAVQALL
jgi:hypothetical protein